MNRRTFKQVPKADVGGLVQDCVEDGATEITVTPDGAGTYTVVAILP